MNNPFLSDRNIFSKVVNPLKKKPESEKQKKDGLPLEQISRNQFNTLKHNQGTTKNTEVPLTNNYHSYKQAPNMTSNPNSKPSTLGKMSFGKPVEVESETKFAYNNNYQLSHKTAVDEYIPKTVTGEYQKQQNFNINTNDSRPFLRNDYRSLSMEQNFDLASPNQQMKFEQYRKANNYNEYSPIEPQVSQKLEDSQFLNIDAIGDDLNKFLASSKNQQQICKLLGINVQPKKKQQFQRYKVDKQNEIKTVNRFAAPKESNNTATMFYKQKKVQPQIEMYRPPLIVENSKEDKQYVPTFNYVGLQQQKETFSREEDDVPRFATNIQLNKAHKSEKERESIEVFNYSQVNTPKTQTSLQDLLNEEMNSLAWNGKYRTFLTSSQKIVTFRYKMQPL